MNILGSMSDSKTITWVQAEAIMNIVTQLWMQTSITHVFQLNQFPSSLRRQTTANLPMVAARRTSTYKALIHQTSPIPKE